MRILQVYLLIVFINLSFTPHLKADLNDIEADFRNSYAALINICHQRTPIMSEISENLRFVFKVGPTIVLLSSASPCYQSDIVKDYPLLITNTELVEKIYTDILSRTPDTEGQSYWENRLTDLNSQGVGIGLSGDDLSRYTISYFIVEFIHAVIKYDGTLPAALLAQQMFLNKIEASLYFVDTLGERIIEYPPGCEFKTSPHYQASVDTLNGITEEQSTLDASLARTDTYVNTIPEGQLSCF